MIDVLLLCSGVLFIGACIALWALYLVCSKSAGSVSAPDREPAAHALRVCMDAASESALVLIVLMLTAMLAGFLEPRLAGAHWIWIAGNGAAVMMAGRIVILFARLVGAMHLCVDDVSGLRQKKLWIAGLTRGTQKAAGGDKKD